MPRPSEGSCGICTLFFKNFYWNRFWSYDCHIPITKKSPFNEEEIDLQDLPGLKTFTPATESRDWDIPVTKFHFRALTRKDGLVLGCYVGEDPYRVRTGPSYATFYATWKLGQHLEELEKRRGDLLGRE